MVTSQVESRRDNYLIYWEKDAWMGVKNAP